MPTNPFFSWSDPGNTRFVRGTTVKAEAVNAALDMVTSGFDGLQNGVVAQAITLPLDAATKNITLAPGLRAGLVVGFDAAGNITALPAGLRWRGNWVTATAYVVNDIFKDAVTGNLYIVVTPHTSGTLATDISNGLDVLLVDVATVTAASTAAVNAATTATTQAGIATTQAGLATTNGAAQVTLATAQAGIATTQAGIATTQAGVATTQAGNATTTYTNFDKRFLGAKASDPTVDNQGAALTVGALYFNTTAGQMRVYDGTVWTAAYVSSNIYVNKSGDTMSGALNFAPLVSVASAATTNIGAAASNSVTVTGTTTITAFDTIASGALRVLTFAAALTLTHNATSLILPTAANIAVAAGDVAVMQSLGAGNWKCIVFQRASGAPLLASGAPTITVRDEKTSGTDGGSFTSGAFQTRTLNTVQANAITGASLSSNQVTLPAGTYMASARAQAFNVQAHKVRLQNITDSTTVALGSSQRTDLSGGCGNDSYITGVVFTIAASKTFELQHRCSSTQTTNGLGVSSGFAVNEVYAELTLTKVA